MFRTAFIGAAATLATAALVPTTAPAPSSATPPPPDQVTISVAQVNGSGCRPGSASVAVSPDKTAFTVTYSEYLAQVGKGAKPTDFRKNCQLGLRVNVPQGYTYAILQADYRGYADLERGASATQNASYYFQGMSGTARRSHAFRGPLRGNWEVSDRTGIESLVFARCGTTRNLNINTELVVNGGSSDLTNTNSFMMMDSTDGSFSTVYQFAWKKCPVR
ncbi:DUF4360 domain-containing protein [Streptomyces sp. NPDC021093]|uniref:DUF4360 domain-containing protein n=1 Tax=Streptomyces sp. NPDC021093 TaxID=3365112 RepID=UPI00378D1492